MVEKPRIIGIIQARMSSDRLPGKVMMTLLGGSILENVVRRVKMSNMLDDVWIATSESHDDDIISAEAKRLGVKCYRGSLDDVLNRFCKTAEKSNADIVVRITADNPLTDPNLINLGLETFLECDVDYLNFEGVPYGSGVEIVKADLLYLSDDESKSEYDHEHVTPFIKSNPHIFNIKQLINPIDNKDYSNIRITIDTPEDLISLMERLQLFKKIEDVSLVDLIRAN